ncbi:MAG: 50S ribosomal protein L18 [Candidatus Paceibacterota bacterium]|jgi:large subunit ribosomal protein L18
MTQQKVYNEKRQRRAQRVHAQIVGTAERPRISIFRSNAHVFVQLIDDQKGETLASVSDYGTKKNAGAKPVRVTGQALAQKLASDFVAQAKERGTTAAVLDRGALRYHGFVKMLTEAIRKEGIRI